MAEKKGVGHAYNVDFLNVVFAASSLFLFLSVIWMVWDDYDREWKTTQRRFSNLELQVTQAQLQQASRSVDRAKLQQMQAQRQAAEKNVAANRAKVDELQAKLKEADNKLLRATLDMQYMKATYDQDRYDFEASRAAGTGNVARKQQIAEEEAKKLDDLELARQKAEAERAEIQKQLGQYTGQAATLSKQIEDTNAEQTRLRKRLDVIAPSVVKDYVRNAPLLDFMAPTIKIQQIILPDVVDDVNFIRVPKMDRCQTCHLAIDKKGYEKYPEPFTTHPNLETFLGSSSPHPIDRVGCTVCHEGMGQSVSFRDAAHAPRDEKQKEEWEKKYHWEEPHLWDYPMLPTRMTEASCAKCHKQQVYVPHADNLDVAYGTFERAGCYACHKTRGFDTNMRKPGPILTKIDSKLSYEWIYNWVRDPKHYSPATYMPNLRLTDAQVADVATYLSTLKGSAGDPRKASPDSKTADEVLLDYLKNVMPLDDARAQMAKMNAQQKQIELGQRAISRYGCFSCHEIKGFENAQSIGTDLSEEGSKLVTRLDFAFITDIPHTSKIAWFRTKLHDPRIFDKGRVLQPLEKLRMPNYDFTDDEIQRLVTAIMSFQRDIQPPAAMPARSARYDFLQNGRTLVHRRNCVGCHIIEGSGGDFVKLVEDPSLGPPMLTPEGARVQADWLYAFIRGPITIRPWLSVRMPTFGLDDQNLNGVIRYFGSISNTIGPFQTHEIVRASNTEPVGKELFEKLQCQTCHVLGTVPTDQPTSNLAPDLRMTPERLNPDWILDWLKKPSDILPGTRMPAFWPDYPKSFYPELNGNAEAQMRAIRDHLMTFRGGPSPKPGAAKSANNN